MSDSICMCVRVFVCGYVCMFECLSVWICAKKYVCMSVYVIIYACMLVCLYRSRVHACVYAHVCACILRAPKYTCQHTPIHAPWQDYSRNPPPHDLCTVIWFIHNSSPPTSPSFYFRIVCVCMRDTHKHTHAYTHIKICISRVLSPYTLFSYCMCVYVRHAYVYTRIQTRTSIHFASVVPEHSRIFTEQFSVFSSVTCPNWTTSWMFCKFEYMEGTSDLNSWKEQAVWILTNLNYFESIQRAGGSWSFALSPNEVLWGGKKEVRKQCLEFIDREKLCIWGCVSAYCYRCNVARYIHVRDVSHSYVWRVNFIRVPTCIQVWDVTQSCV